MALEDAQEKLTAEVGMTMNGKSSRFRTVSSNDLLGPKHQQSRGARNVRVTRSVTVMISYVRALSFRQEIHYFC
eukprot:g4548.t1